MKKYVYLFSEGDASMRTPLGGKGANLAEMAKLGLPVPQGFTITTEACTRYYDDDRQINADIQAQIDAAVLEMEKITGKKFGDKQNPLFVSVKKGINALTFFHVHLSKRGHSHYEFRSLTHYVHPLFLCPYSPCSPQDMV